MKKLAFLMVLLTGLSAWAGTIHISPSPVPLKGAFQVEVMGLQAEGGDAVVVNVNTGELVRVPLKPQGGKLVSEEIYALRDCDAAPEGAEYVLHVAVGQVIAAATELEDGLSTTALVSAPTGPVELALKAWDEARKAWCPRAGGSELSPGRILVTVSDPAKDLTCDRESVPVTISLGGSEVSLDLREEGPASGGFSAELALRMAPKGTDLVVELVHQRHPLCSVPVGTGLELKLAYGELTLSFPIHPLTASLELSPGRQEDVGCPVQISVAGAEPDEVIWFVDGIEQPERGGELRLIRSQPTYPDEIQVVALIRQGGLWGKAETSVSFVPPTEIAFVDAGTGEPVSGSCPCGRELAVKLTCAYDDPAPRVWIGILGPNCSAQEIPLVSQGDGIYLSQTFSTNALSACAGDVLWAQYKDPTCPEDVAYVLLVLR